MVSQYLQTLESTSYEQDEGSFIADFLRRPTKTNNVEQFKEIPPVLSSEIQTKIIHISKKELNSLYSICEQFSKWIVSKLNKVRKHWIDSAGSTTYNTSLPYSGLLQP